MSHNWFNSRVSGLPRSRQTVRSLRRPQRQKNLGRFMLAGEPLENRWLLSTVPFSELQKLTASDAAQNDYFGTSVAVSADGQIVVVGAPLNNGSAYVYQWNRSSFTFVEQQMLSPSDWAEEMLGTVARWRSRRTDRPWWLGPLMMTFRARFHWFSLCLPVERLQLQLRGAAETHRQ